jgi:hypothetical protein
VTASWPVWASASLTGTLEVQSGTAFRYARDARGRFDVLFTGGVRLASRAKLAGGSAPSVIDARNLLRILEDAIAVQVDNGAVAVDDRGAIAGSTWDRCRTDIVRKLRTLTDCPRDRDNGAPVHGAIVRCLQHWFAGFAGLAGAGRCGPCRSRRLVNATERVLRKSRSSHSE